MGAAVSSMMDEYHAVTEEIRRVRTRDANNQRYIQHLYRLLAHKDDELEEQEGHIRQLHRQLVQKNDELDAKDALIDELKVHLKKENKDDNEEYYDNDADADIRAMLYREDNFVLPEAEVKKEPLSHSSSLLPTTEARHTSYASSLPDLVASKLPPSPPYYSPTPAPRDSPTPSSSSSTSPASSPLSISSRKRRSPSSDDQNPGLKRLRTRGNNV